MLSPLSHFPLSPPPLTVLLVSLWLEWIALVSASRHLLLIPRCLTSLHHFTHSLILNLCYPPGFTTSSPMNVCICFYFHLPPIPLVVLFQSSVRLLFVLLLIDLFIWPYLPSLHIFPKWSPFHPWHHYHPCTDGCHAWTLSWAQT